MSLLDMLQLTRPLILIDTETTGPNPSQDRIVELGFIQIKPDGTRTQWETFVNPMITIPREATSVHGITDEMVQTAPTFARIAPNLMLGFKDCDWAGYNIKTFDLPLLRAEFERAGHIWSYSDAHILDGFRLWQIGMGRTLSDASEYFLGRKHEGAHRALDDVLTSHDVILDQLQRFKLPRDIKALHEMCWPPNPDALDPDGKLVWKDGQVIFNFGKKWRGRSIMMIPQKDLRWIAEEATGINPTVRKICAEAARGNFPRPPAAAGPATVDESPY